MVRQQTFFTSKGAPFQLTKELGRGGEGAVFETAGTPGVVAKIYHETLTPLRQEKLRVMVSLHTPALAEFAIWPLDTLHASSSGPVCGFTMARLGHYKDLFELYIPSNRKRAFPHADWRFLIQAARNAAAAVATMHHAGHVVGDINPKNFVVSAKALVQLIDTDSFQIASNGRVFPCEVGVPHFTAPELQGKPFKGVIRSPNHDNFALAILCFHLLVLGRHPFAGRFSGQGDMPIEHAISEFRYAYSQESSATMMAPPPNSLPMRALPSSIRGLFEAAFGQKGTQGNRPSAVEWLKELDDLGKNLVVCPVFASHQYHRALTHCPWCELEKTAGVVLFLDSPKPAAPPFDLESVWRQILGISAPSQLSPPQYKFAFSPAPLPESVLNAKSPKWPWSRHPIDETVAQRRDAYKQAESEWIRARKRWETANEAGDFQRKFRELEQIKRQYAGLLLQYDDEKRRMELNARSLQLQAFLDNHHLNRASISGIGAARRATLISFGIETAADINEAAISQIPGFGPTLTNELIQWRQAVERRFAFDPRRGVSPTDLAVLQHKYATQKQGLEQQLLKGSSELEYIGQQTTELRVVITGQLEEAARAFAQAEISYSVSTAAQRRIGTHRTRQTIALFTFALIALVVITAAPLSQLGSIALLRDLSADFTANAGAVVEVASPLLPTATQDLAASTEANTSTSAPLVPLRSVLATPTHDSVKPAPEPSSSPILPVTPTPIPTVSKSVPSNQPTPVVAVVRENSNLRTGPGMQYNVERTVSAGTKVVVIGSSNDNLWYRLVGDEWIYANLVQLGADGTSTSTERATVPAFRWALVVRNNVNVYSDANLESQVLRSLRRGDCIQVAEGPDDWLRVRIQDNKTGWSLSYELIIVDTCPMTSPTTANQPPPAYVNSPMYINAVTIRETTIHECFGGGANELRQVSAGTPIEVLGVGAFRPPLNQIVSLGPGPYLKIRLWDGQVAWMSQSGVTIDSTQLPSMSAICEEYDRLDWSTVDENRPPTPNRTGD